MNSTYVRFPGLLMHAVLVHVAHMRQAEAGSDRRAGNPRNCRPAKWAGSGAWAGHGGCGLFLVWDAWRRKGCTRAIFAPVGR